MRPEERYISAASNSRVSFVEYPHFLERTTVPLVLSKMRLPVGRSEVEFAGMPRSKLNLAERGASVALRIPSLEPCHPAVNTGKPGNGIH